ncbi:translation initiation factor eIF-2B [Chloroflexota bacterium]
MNISAEITSLIDEIKNNKTDGASELARQAAKVLKIAAKHSQTNSTKEFLLEQKELERRLISARPAMAPVTNIVSRLLNTLIRKAARMDLDSIRQLAISEADKLVADSLKAIAQIAKYSSRLIIDGDKIMTHSYSSTVVAALKEAFSKHADVEVVTTRSGPGHTGERIAQELGDHGIPVTLIGDTAVGLYISNVNKVMVGADRVCADGAVVNGIGTYQLALVSERDKIPFYVLCDTLKFDPKLKSNEVELEEKEPSEIVEPGRLPPKVRIKNPYFDITPPELVTAVVTENELFTAKKLSTIWKETLVK